MSGFIDGILICLGIILGIITDNLIKNNYDIPITYNKGYSVCYKRAKLIYECDHDRTECEILKDTL